MPKQLAWAGIDPGVSGCACLITSEKIWFHDYVDDRKASDIIDQWHHEFKVKFCLEKVSMIRVPATVNKDGKKSKPFFGTSPKLIANYGMWRGFLIAFNCNYVEKTPNQWQKVMPGKARKGEDKKDRSLHYARKYYPAAASILARKKDNNRADALLIAHYVRQGESG